MSQEPNKPDQEMWAEYATMWKLLYDGDFDEVPNPNKPEDTARFNVVKKQRSEQLARFFKGPGAPVLEIWKKALKTKNMYLLYGIDLTKCDCKCEAVLTIRDMRNVLDRIREMENILQDANPDKKQ